MGAAGAEASGPRGPSPGSPRLPGLSSRRRRHRRCSSRLCQCRRSLDLLLFPWLRPAWQLVGCQAWGGGRGQDEGKGKVSQGAALLDYSQDHGFCSVCVGSWGQGNFVAGTTLTKCFFNYSDLPCYMTMEEIKSLIRLPDIIARAKQNITTVEISASTGEGLATVLLWLQNQHRPSS